MLKLTKNPNVIYFNSDDEFYKFCVVPVIIPKEFINPNNGETMYKMDFDFSNDYLDAINSGKRFIIKDENSQIYKRGCVSYRTVTKRINNLDKYINKGF